MSSTEPALPEHSELALRIEPKRIEATLAQAVQSFNRQSEADDAQRPATALHPIYQDLRRQTITLRHHNHGTLELCLGVVWHSRLRRQPWMVTLARIKLNLRALATTGTHEPKTHVQIVREAARTTALRTVSTLLRPSAYLTATALLLMPFVTTWPLVLMAAILAIFVLGTFFPAYWKMAIRSHALPALDALVAAAVRDHVHRDEIPEPYRDRSEG